MRLRILSTEDTSKIHTTTLSILREIGMDVRDEETRKELKQAGCIEAESGYLLFPEEVVNRSLEKIPERFVLYDRNGNCRVDTNDSRPFSGALSDN